MWDIPEPCAPLPPLGPPHSPHIPRATPPHPPCPSATPGDTLCSSPPSSPLSHPVPPLSRCHPQCHPVPHPLCSCCHHRGPDVIPMAPPAPRPPASPTAPYAPCALSHCQRGKGVPAIGGAGVGRVRGPPGWVQAGGCPTVGGRWGAAPWHPDLETEGEGARVGGLLVSAAAPQRPGGTRRGAGGGRGHASLWHLWGRGWAPG